MSTEESAWQKYLESELPIISGMLAQHGVSLLPDQPHIKGERFLIRALTTIGGQKLILLGVDTKTGNKVVVKASRDYQGKAELRHERKCRSLLHTMKFSYESFHSPKELSFIETDGYVLYVGEFIEQSASFLERPLSEQFSFALRALKAQEQTRATTANHIRTVKNVFGTRVSEDYLLMTDGFLKTVLEAGDEFKAATTLIETAKKLLMEHRDRIEQYTGFLTHTDFVPHNFRIKDDTLYLLDFSSLRFGNKHESWARFLNFMTLYNRDLEELLLKYVSENRSMEEQASLHLMRIFRLTELIAYYSLTLKRSTENLLELNRSRVHFWTKVLEAELANRLVAPEVVSAYQTKRDELRSTAEKERQIGLH